MNRPADMGGHEGRELPIPEQAAASGSQEHVRWEAPKHAGQVNAYVHRLPDQRPHVVVKDSTPVP